MTELHPDLVLKAKQAEFLEEIGVNPPDLYPIRHKEMCAPSGTGWADTTNGFLIFFNGEPGRFRYWMGSERADLVCKHRGIMVYDVGEEVLRYHPDPRKMEAV